MSEYLEDQTSRFQADSRELAKRQSEWPDFERWALKSIQEWIDNAKKSGYYEFLYLITEKQIQNEKRHNQSFIQFYAGSHPTGISKTIRDQQKGTFRLEGVAEDSGCLSIVQEPKGGVFVIAYPSKSDVLQWEDSYVVLRYFNRPSKIQWFDLRKAIEFYLRFARYTSIHSEPTLPERVDLWWIKFRFGKAWRDLLRGAGFGLRMVAAAKTGLPPV